MPILKTKALKEKFEDFLIERIGRLTQKPRLVIVMVGNDFVSLKYVQIKLELAKKLGIETEFVHLADNVSREIVEQKVQEATKKQAGLIFQLPIRADLVYLVDQISPEIDVDLLGVRANVLQSANFLPPTVGAIDLVLKLLRSPSLYEAGDFLSFVEEKIDYGGTTVAVIGQGKLVGRPLLDYFASRTATLISLNSDSKEKQFLTKQADIIVSAAGKAGLVGPDWVWRNDANTNPKNLLYPLVIDAGTSEAQSPDSTSLIKGDVDAQALADFATVVGVPGGIGSITVRYLFWNLVKLFEKI